MASKTPQFDKALDEILKNLKPHKKICKKCEAEFEIFREDAEMYQKLRVPPPTLCSFCRMQRRMSYYLRFPPFYRKPCSVPGHTEQVITLFPNSGPHKIYDNVHWRSDAWSELDYGREFDLRQPFFEQFRKLFFDVPHQALFVDPQSVNSEYAIGGVAAKNCYYVSTPLFSEDILYSFGPAYSRDSVDVNEIERCELLYESTHCYNCFNCNFCLNTHDTRDSWFLYDCRNCSNCFMSSNLRNKSYYFYNQPLTKDEYESKIQSLDLERRSRLEYFKSEFKKIYADAVHKMDDNINIVESIGNRLKDCKRCFWVFWAFENCENMRYVQYALRAKDLVDVTGVNNASLSYETTGISDSSRLLFSVNIRDGNFIEYSAYCRDSDYCFGSVGLKNKKFCIFNRQYDEKSYGRILDDIKLNMLNRGEYGELFPLRLGLIPYQNTPAQIQFPMDKITAKMHDIPWYDDEGTTSSFSIEILEPHEVPDTIKEVDDKILEKSIRCLVTKKPFRIIKPELDFYRERNLPLPVVHPDQRMRSRFNMVNLFRLWQCPCSKCGKLVHTSYNPVAKFKVYCESCYLKEVV